jgi:hypothetical protein
MKQSVRSTAYVGAALVVGLVAMPGATQQGSAPPIARYTMDAGTTSGMAAMGAAGANPMAILRGGVGGGAIHELQLRLGSSQAATGAPSADHFMPVGADLGPSVPLVTPVGQPSVPTGPAERPQQGQLPSGKLYLFWGCGEHAPAGQPVVVDFAKMARGQVPPNLLASGVNLPEDWRITPRNSKTFGEWPNPKSPKQVPSSASLRGGHRIAGNYSPEIAFTLDHDFMPALQPKSSAMASGAYGLNWNGLPEATGYYAWAMGAKDMGRGQANEMVWWTSASTQQFGGSLWDWLSPGAVAKLVAAKTVMPPSQTSCTVPAEVTKLGGQNMMLNMYAYGPQSEFAYPPRPANSKAVWKPQWIARVRFRANSMIMLGMPDMGNLGNYDTDDSDRTERTQPQQQSGKPKCPGGFRGAAMRAAGACS